MSAAGTSKRPKRLSGLSQKLGHGSYLGTPERSAGPVNGRQFSLSYVAVRSPSAHAKSLIFREKVTTRYARPCPAWLTLARSAKRAAAYTPVPTVTTSQTIVNRTLGHMRQG